MENIPLKTTWAEMMRVHIAILETARTKEAKNASRMEIMRCAEIADKHVEMVKKEENKERNVQGFSESDIMGLADQDGEELTDEDVLQVMDRMEKVFDANYGMCWDVISDCIKHVLSEKEKGGNKDV